MLIMFFIGYKIDIEFYMLNEVGVFVVVLIFFGVLEYVYSSVEFCIVDIYKMLVDVFVGQIVMIFSRSVDGFKLLVYVSSDINLGEYYFF